MRSAQIRPRALAALRRWRVARLSLGAVGVVCAAMLMLAAPAGATSGVGLANWTSASWSILGDRVQPLEFTINPQNVNELAPKWVFTTHGDVSATPTVSDGVVYFPDWGGYLNAVNAQTGKEIWQAPISSYDGTPGQVSRNSPLILGNELILGDNALSAQPGGAHLFAVNRANGHLIWSTEIDSDPAAVVTSNPVALGNEIVVGVSSQEEDDAVDPNYDCCGFRGAVVAVDAVTGKLLWKTYTVPSNTSTGGDENTPCAAPNGPSGCGYSGGAVWATPTIDPLTGQVFVGTGNNYTAPDAAVACQNATTGASPPTSDANCTAPDDYFDSVIALNLYTGRLEWGHKVEGWDAWTVACAAGEAPGATWCPSPASPDFDFGGSSPNLMVIQGANGLPETVVGDGQKSGVYWAFDAATGKVVWDTLVGPGTALGGIEWGSAYDGERIYTAEADAYEVPYNLLDGQSIVGGTWDALNPQTGTIEWQTPTPGGVPALGPVSEADGVVYAGSMDPSPTDPDMFALSASTGKILWAFPSGASVNSSPAIVNGVVYWGSGYSRLGPSLPFSGNDKLYAFSLKGQ